MTAPKWEASDCGGWLGYVTPTGLTFYIDKLPDGKYQAIHNDRCLGPSRMTQQTALNDCKRYALKLRAELVNFGRCKL